MYKQNMPKKLKRHLVNFLRLTGVYIAILGGLGAGQILSEAATGVNEFAIFQLLANVMYFSISAWFVWRMYTGLCRDLDFYLDD